MSEIAPVSNHSDNNPIHQGSTVVIVLDGLRPEFVRYMPRLERFGQNGVVCTRHHSAIPTVTRVNALSLVTGCYPGKHGLLGNVCVVKDSSGYRKVDTASHSELLANAGDIFTAEHIQSLLQKSGIGFDVFGTCSSGCAWLLGRGGAADCIINPQLVLPKFLATYLRRSLEPSPTSRSSANDRSRWMVDTFLRLERESGCPRVSVIWFSEPDATVHEAGLGSPKMIASLQKLDLELGRVLEAVLEQGANVFVLSDHGASSRTGIMARGLYTGIKKLLVQEGLKESSRSGDVTKCEGAIYVKNRDERTIEKIVQLLRKVYGVGMIATRENIPGSHEGWVNGTLSLGAVFCDHERAPDILISENFTDASNEFDVRGVVPGPGKACHGSASPYDIHSMLMAAGPAIKAGTLIESPTGIVDIMPTLLSLYGIEIPASIHGRVLRELFADNLVAAETVRETARCVTTDIDGDQFVQELHESWIGSYRYVDCVVARRLSRENLAAS